MIYPIVFVLLCILMLLRLFSGNDGFDDLKAGNAALSQGNDNKAALLLTKSIDSGQLSQQNQVIAFYNRGLAWDHIGKYDKSIADYSKAIQLDPNMALVFNNRALVWIHKGEYGKAIADCNEAIRLDPSMARAFFNRGEVHFVQASFREAFRDFMQAQKLDSGNVYFAIWSFLAHFRGEGLANYSSKQMPIEKQFDMNVWPAPVVSMFAGQVGPEVVLSRAADDDAVVQKNQVCEANFYVGELYLLQQKKNQARDYFQKAKRGCPREYIEFMGAIAELKRM